MAELHRVESSLGKPSMEFSLPLKMADSPKQFSEFNSLASTCSACKWSFCFLFFFLKKTRCKENRWNRWVQKRKGALSPALDWYVWGKAQAETTVRFGRTWNGPVLGRSIQGLHQWAETQRILVPGAELAQLCLLPLLFSSLTSLLLVCSLTLWKLDLFCFFRLPCRITL